MGSGASIPDTLTAEEARSFAGDNFDQGKFDAAADADGNITKSQMEEACASFAAAESAAAAPADADAAAAAPAEAAAKAPAPSKDDGKEDGEIRLITPRDPPSVQRKIMVMFGPPGSGKGTHAPHVVKNLNTPQLSTGDMLRAAVAAQTEVGKQADAVMKAGALVSDEIVVGIIKERIQADDCKPGFLLDGFPRTLEQAKALDAVLAETGEAVWKILALEVPEEVLEERICGRWVHKESGASYHVKFKPPKSLLAAREAAGEGVEVTPSEDNMLDDETQGKLMQRKDDTAEALKTRLEGYRTSTVPILEHYEPKGVVSKINANQDLEAIAKDVVAAIS